MQLFTKSRIRPLQCVQWTRKEVALIFSTLQSQQGIFSEMDAADTRFAVSDSWVSTKAPICGKSQRLSLFSEHHQQDVAAVNWSTSSPRLPLRTGWSVLICCPIRVMVFNTHTPPTHLSYYCRVCSCLPVLLTPLDGLPSCQLLPPNTNTKTGIIV